MLTISKGYVKYFSKSAMFSMNNMRNGPKNGPNNGPTKGPRMRLAISDLRASIEMKFQRIMSRSILQTSLNLQCFGLIMIEMALEMFLIMVPQKISE